MLRNLGQCVYACSLPPANLKLRRNSAKISQSAFHAQTVFSAKAPQVLRVATGAAIDTAAVLEIALI
jgi:hypothetical protein